MARAREKERVVFITQARRGSSRLPGKILETVEGRTLLEWFLLRASRIGSVDLWCVATTEAPGDDAVAEVVRRAFPSFVVVRGSERDVLGRYAQAMGATDAHVVVRIASDCPFLDWNLVDECVALLRREGADLVKTRREELPVGLDVEVFRGEALLRADREASDPRHREHVGPYVYEHPELFRVCFFPYGGEPWPSCRLTLDYPEDLAFVRAVYGALSPEAPASEVRRYLAQNPQVCAINGFRGNG